MELPDVPSAGLVLLYGKVTGRGIRYNLATVCPGGVGYPCRFLHRNSRPGRL